MAKKKIQNIIEEIEIFVDNCKFVPLSSTKISVPKDELESMLQELKMKLPAEIEQSKKIIRNRDNMLNDAKNRGDAMVEAARKEADRLVEESVVVQQAMARAEEIIAEANANADEIVEAANNEAREVRLSAMMYTKDQVENIRVYVANTLEAEKKNYENLIASLENDDAVLSANSEEMSAQIAAMNNQPIPERQKFAQSDASSYNLNEEIYDEEDDDEDEEDDVFDDDDMDY